MGERDAPESIETASLDELRALQLDRLRSAVRRAYERVPHSRAKLDAAGVHPDDLRSLDDLARFPFTTKDDLRETYPFGMFAVPMAEIVRVHASSGTTGKPTVVGYTIGDIEIWADLMARSIRAAGGHSSDIVHNAYGYGLFTGGLGFHYGAERLGAAVVPASGGATERHVRLVTDFRATIITATPSYLLTIADEFERQGLNPGASSLRLAICGAEPWGEAMRAEIETRLGLDALDHYGLSEMIGPGVAQECIETRDGLTLWEDHFYPEIIDPATGAVLPDGEAGELVLTSLNREAMPLIRYRTRDLTRLLPGTARTMRRIERVKGRSDDMLIIRGVNVFPSQIEAVLATEPRLAPHYVLEVTRPGRLDELAVLVETRAEDGAVDSEEQRTELEARAEHLIKAHVGVTSMVRVVPPRTIERSEGKARRGGSSTGGPRHSGEPDMDASVPLPGGSPEDPAAILVAAGIPAAGAAEWLASEQTRTADLATDRNRYASFWQRSAALVAALPPKPKRNPAEAAAVALIHGRARGARERFLASHAEAVYDEVTAREMLRVEDLVFAAAAAVPGLTPSPEAVAAEAALNQGDKDDIEIDQGIFVAHVLASPRTGTHLCHAMLLPLRESTELAARFAMDGRLDLGPVRLDRRGKAVHVTASSPRFLNAEDDSTLRGMEVAVDVAILDRDSEIMVVRGGAVDHPKYGGRRVFGAGINLTHLYRGKIPFVWFLKRDLGYIHKLFRGVARPDAVPDDLAGRGIEKPWIAVVESFAIGGHCQLLLVADYVLAADDAFMSLPARKEGIIPGFANLRLPRLTGERIAREAILYERKLACDSVAGRMICDEIASADAMDAAIDRVVTGLTDAGPVSAVGNRRAFRVAQEPLEDFRRYGSVYAREQAYCHFSPALIQNLERNWDAKNRRG